MFSPDLIANDALAYARDILPTLTDSPVTIRRAVDVSAHYAAEYGAEGSTFDVHFNAYGAEHVFTVWRNERGEIYGEW
ncbi:MAG: hypothetical protein ACXW13_00055 [Burkholderiaceae bacterium]